ncbi:MAG: class I SAM-dependent methyltransferase [Chloroflexi bacterium]|nr:class I SAM-dependent methyltransferase [Chloroflexota bacterium]
MKLIRRIFFNLMYFRRPPWDSGITPPELYAFIEQHPPGRAIDLGCGTGTNVITLAQHGWDVTGVDFASRAIKFARRKVKAAGVQADLRIDDVTKLTGIQGPFDLALDMGCFHSLSGDGITDYLDRLDEILAPGGFWLMYGFFKSAPDQPGPGLVEADVDVISARFDLVSRTDGGDKVGRASAWFLFRKRP